MIRCVGCILIYVMLVFVIIVLVLVGFVNYVVLRLVGRCGLSSGCVVVGRMVFIVLIFSFSLVGCCLLF